MPRPFAHLFAMSSAQSSTDPYNPKALPKKPPPPLRPCVKSHPPTLPSKQRPPIIVFVYQMQAPPAVAKKAPPPILDGIRMQAPPAVVKRAPPPRSNHKPKSSPNVTVEAENTQPAPPLRALPLKAPAQQAALKAPPPKLSSETNIKTSN